MWQKLIRRIPRKRHIRGTWLHRTAGEKIFAHELWYPSRHGVAAGAATGLFWAMMPIPFQMAPSAISAYFLKFHLPTAMISVWITNPFTWPLILYWQYRLGGWILGEAKTPVISQTGTIEMVMQVPGPLLLGCIISGVLLAGSAYISISTLWRLLPKKKLKVATKLA